ncbi:MAG: glycosyl hydrolase [Ignavibacteriales bacterium]|nr:MAG: glycosyl hydrolase [Ignavibacteriales bacterium]
MKKIFPILFLLVVAAGSISFAQNDDEKKDSSLSDLVGGLKWRNIGPAFCSGRIADFAVNPNNFSEYYVAVASGNIWKTNNAGTTFEPIFDNHGSYSIGCLALDPNNPFVVWAGTGENNHQRALGYGDGVYKSVDGGKSWKNMGLKESRQIGEIIIDPRNSNIVFVAAEGSAWGPGGERGLYKTVDGGKTWKKVLDISEHTGVNNLAFDPRNPDVMYATSEQRRRHVFTKIGGGPETAVYKSVDGGENWDKIMSGLPKVDLGGMDIVVSPVNPDVLYIILEAAEDKGGFFRSVNRGATWEKMSDYTSSGQYFNEIVCDPKNVDKIYSLEVVSKVSLDAGKTWKPINSKNRHVDDHAMWINPGNPDHFMIGGDGGIYESFDCGASFDFKENLPITQFYRVNVDNSYPFYYVYGGTQDNNSMGGPSQTISSDGIVNNDWFVTNGGDGFWTAVDPENPNIVYAEAQYGNMVRYDRKSGEAIDIRPEPLKGELTYKWNWDTPLLISPHNNKRVYVAANFVFRSEDRGDSWTRISDDLTRQLDRNTWQVMGKFWSIDAVAKDKSTSLFGTIISLSESPVKENLLYAGTDDGLIQVSEDAKTWRKISDFPGVPEFTYVSDIAPSKFNENIVFASFNNLKRDDFKPYVLRSDDKGKSWTSISGNLPLNGSVHTIEQDFINPDLLFAGTEFGIFFTTDGGKIWTQLKNGIPTISVKDIAIQKREHDLVLATFGRGFYILDNYSPLRDLNESMTKKDAHLFPVKDALTYIQSGGRYGQGDTYYKASNPEFGAVISFYLKDVPKTLNKIRKDKEKELFKKGEPIYQPTDEELRLEKEEKAPYVILTITDENGSVVRKLTKSASKGINRIVWDLSYHSVNPVNDRDKFNPTADQRSSTLVLPGKYRVSLSLVSREGIKELDSPVEFKVKPLMNTTLPIAQREELVAFQKQANEMLRTVRGSENFLNDLLKRIEAIKIALLSTPLAPPDLMLRAQNIEKELKDISLLFRRDSDRPSAEETPPSPPTFNERLGILVYVHNRSTSPITMNEKNAYKILTEEFPPVLDRIKRIHSVDINNLEDDLEKYDAPWTPGRIPEFKLK